MCMIVINESMIYFVGYDCDWQLCKTLHHLTIDQVTCRIHRCIDHDRFCPGRDQRCNFGNVELKAISGKHWNPYYFPSQKLNEIGIAGIAWIGKNYFFTALD